MVSVKSQARLIMFSITDSSLGRPVLISGIDQKACKPGLAWHNAWFQKSQASLNGPDLINGFDQKPGLPESVWSNHVLHQTAGSFGLPALITGLKGNLAWLGLA